MSTEPYSVRCSFCGKGPKEVNRLIVGPRPTAVCDDCVRLCSDIIAERDAEDSIRQRMKESGEVIVSAADAERLAWMRTWSVGEPEKTGRPIPGWKAGGSQ